VTDRLPNHVDLDGSVWELIEHVLHHPGAVLAHPSGRRQKRHDSDRSNIPVERLT